MLPNLSETPVVLADLRGFVHRDFNEGLARTLEVFAESLDQIAGDVDLQNGTLITCRDADDDRFTVVFELEINSGRRSMRLLEFKNHH